MYNQFFLLKILCVSVKIFNSSVSKDYIPAILITGLFVPIRKCGMSFSDLQVR